MADDTYVINSSADCRNHGDRLAADIPIREVILYKSGVGYFERGGTLQPGESARLDFKASDMNDVLKSLTICGPERRQDHRPALRFERTAGSEAGRFSVSRSEARHR